ncbi:6-phosphofructokinase 1 [Micromonospora pallida]|uniref:6-phosphofructokinase 1 n=1 Tax=Micromonospora pallida TaxID=145854 RepID=A0A1C6SSV0_9ACTN|nr:diphosphate--fructose-6-phosphate 1-phosphotransferase [Micromonospora pallida]SCL32439.1 6-phosphofructokinase 1 [Micromonospora pallida]
MRLLIGQTGAPTSVVNASLRGFLAGAEGHDVLALRGGPDGLVDGRFTPVTLADVPPEWTRRGGSWLGAGRRAVTDDDLDAAVATLAEHRVDGVALIGGNGTMALLGALTDRAERAGLPLYTVGIPKTVDNDLVGVDHCPGFGSAARYLTTVVPDLARDHAAMRSIEPVRIVETLGRSVGWLALAATWHREDPAHAPHLVLLPEVPFDRAEFLRRIADTLDAHGRAFVVTSEGAARELTDEPFDAVNHTRILMGGVSRRLAALVTAELGVVARGEVLGMVQRSAGALASEVDRREAAEAGRRAARLLAEQATGLMVGLHRTGTDPYAAGYDPVPLADVAGRTRPVPPEWCTTDPADLDDFHRWLAPLVTE